MNAARELRFNVKTAASPGRALALPGVAASRQACPFKNIEVVDKAGTPGL